MAQYSESDLRAKYDQIYGAQNAIIDQLEYRANVAENLPHIYEAAQAGAELVNTVEFLRSATTVAGTASIVQAVLEVTATSSGAIPSNTTGLDSVASASLDVQAEEIFAQLPEAASSLREMADANRPPTFDEFVAGVEAGELDLAQMQAQAAAYAAETGAMRLITETQEAYSQVVQMQNDAAQKYMQGTAYQESAYAEMTEQNDEYFEAQSLPLPDYKNASKELSQSVSRFDGSGPGATESSSLLSRLQVKMDALLCTDSSSEEYSRLVKEIEELRDEAYTILDEAQEKYDGLPALPEEALGTSEPVSFNGSDFYDWVAENHPEQLASLGHDGEFRYNTSEAGDFTGGQESANDGQSDYAAAKAEFDALREQYQAEAHDTSSIDSDWDDATGNFDADTLTFIEEAEAEFQAQEAAARQQQLEMQQDPGLIDGFNSVVGGAGQWLGEALVTTFGDEEAQSATAPGQILSPAEQTLQAQAGALNSVLMFQQALEGDNAFAKLTGGVSTLNALNQAGWVDLGQSAGDWSDLGTNLGLITGGINLYESIQSGDGLAIIRSGASLGAQATNMYAAASNSAAAQQLSSSLGYVAGGIGLVQALQAGDELGAAIAAITMVNPAVGAVLSVARALGVFGDEEPPPPTARSSWEYDVAQGVFVETAGESHDGGSLETLRAIAGGIDTTLQSLVAATGGQLIPPESLSLELVQSDTRLYVNGERYGFEQANQAVGNSAIDILQRQLQIEGGDPLVTRALYNSEAQSLEALQGDSIENVLGSAHDDVRESDGGDNRLNACMLITALAA